MIERGRHSRPKIEREHRYCPYCKDTVETETHFITECFEYRDERAFFFNSVQSVVPNFSYMNSQERFCFLLTQEDSNILLLTANVVNKRYEIRNS